MPPPRTWNPAAAAALILLVSLELARPNELCSVRELARGKGSHVVGFGPMGKFRAQHSNNGDVFSLGKGEVELDDGRFYQCMKSNGKWTQIPKIVGIFFKLFSLYATPDNAFKICRQTTDGVAATVYTARQNTVMAMIMKMSGIRHAVIGYSDSKKEGRWVWQSDVYNPYKMTKMPDRRAMEKWAAGEPDNAGTGEDYAILSAELDSFGSWLDVGPPKRTNEFVRWKYSNEQTRPVLSPFWCEMETADDHFVENVALDRYPGSTSSSGILSIEVEKRMWSQVCYDTFTQKSASVVCKMLGFPSGGTYTTALTSLAENISGHLDVGRIILGNFKCNGDEESILDCEHRDDVEQCDEPVWISCYSGCARGSVAGTGGLCLKPCGLGTYGAPGSCAPCPVGYYQDTPRQLSCKACPGGMTTAAIGSLYKSSCVNDIPDTPCGVRSESFFSLLNNEATARIVGGEEALYGEFPWQILLKKNGFAYCGATLIDKDTITTAGHCVHEFTSATSLCYAASDFDTFMEVVAEDHVDLKADPYTAVPCIWTSPSVFSIEAGLTKRFSNSPSVQHRNVVKIYVTPNYIHASGSIHNDIAVMKLSTPLELNDMVIPACLPTKTERSLSGLDLTITGFGSEALGGRGSIGLRKAIVPFVGPEICNPAMMGRVSDNMFCAGTAEGGVDSCTGDSGGPVGFDERVKYPQKYTLRGIISWGVGCAREEFYGVYTDIQKFLTFVEQARSQTIPSSGDDQPSQGTARRGKKG